MDNEYPTEVIEAIAIKVAQDMLETTSDMNQHVLLEIIEALERGEDVYNGLASTVFIRPFMEKFIDELLRYEKE